MVLVKEKMMKKLYLIGNFKMNMNLSELRPYLKSYKKVAKRAANSTGICVPYVYLDYVSRALKGSRAIYGVQDMYYQDHGAYTGEISPSMLQDYDTKLVIIGHSERRAMFGDTDEIVNKKLTTALKYGFTPILCFGETLEEREAGKVTAVIKKQLTKALAGLTKADGGKIFFAYEPIWAIGTGVVPTTEQLSKVVKQIRSIITKILDTTDDEIKLLYGGSLKPSNAKQILAINGVNGGLIGGACLKMEDFKSIIYENVE